MGTDNINTAEKSTDDRDELPDHREISERIVGEIDGVTFTGDDLIGAMNG